MCTNEVIQVQRIAVSSVWVTDTIRWSPKPFQHFLVFPCIGWPLIVRRER